MKIVKIKHKKNNIYELTFENNENICLYDDIILKYELLLKKEIDNKKLTEIIKENSKIESYNIAIKYLNTKLRTKKEIVKKLKNYDNESISYVIDRLSNEGYLNDLLYIKSYINDQINLKMIGPIKILNDLKKLGFNNNDILEYLDSLSFDIWYQKINKYVRKKIDANHNLSALILKQKIIQDLISKGFKTDIINDVISNYSFVDNKDIYEREYEKLKMKLSKKYSDNELEYRLKAAMIKKGFYK